MRVIAETNDGRLYMATRFVKASGGCSAAASKDLEAALANLGEMSLKTYDEAATFGEPREVQIMLRHPNHTGLQMNQLPRLYVPAHFVRKISVDYAGDQVLDVETTFRSARIPVCDFPTSRKSRASSPCGSSTARTCGSANLFRLNP